MNIGFIGFGEAAFNICLGLGREGVTGIRATDAMLNHETHGKQIRARAEQAGVTLMQSSCEIAAWADLVIAAVPSSFTMDVCNEVRGCLQPGQLYVDVSSSTPNTKKAIWEAVRDTGVLFVDAAMLGSLPADQHRVPISACGNGAEVFRDLMTPYGMRITVAGPNPGASSAMKLVRSIFMKGIAALMIDMLQAADAYDVADEVIASIGKTMDGRTFAEHLDWLVTSTAIHCARRGAELKGSAALQEEAGLSSELTAASRHCHEALVKYGFSERYLEHEPTGWKEIIEILREKNPTKES